MTINKAQKEENSADSLIERVDSVRKQVNGDLDPQKRSLMGQYLTPAPIASFMASLFQQSKSRDILLLDPGAGIGSLTAAFIEEFCNHRKLPTSLVAITYELEPRLIKHLKRTLNECSALCTRKNVGFKSRIENKDFIEAGCEILHGGLFQLEAEHTSFTHIIMNPPYRKIRADSLHRRLLRSVGIETGNLYTAFLAIAIRLLEPEGQLVAIVPRSFCNGPYFQPFRELLYANMSLKHIHVFESRRKAFKDDDVLQENIIFHAVKEGTRGDVKISYSSGPDLSDLAVRTVTHDQVVCETDPGLFIHIATSEEDQRTLDRLRTLSCTLEDIDIEVSTGPVVDFRLKEFLRDDPEKGTVPLIYTAHISDHFIEWPNLGGRKPNAIVDAEPVQKWLFPNGTYTLTKRFSSKEERRRIVAAIHDPSRITGERIGFENHLNVYHRHGKELPPLLARGLALYLNSTIVDQYFRIFSGHTQVNAADLRSIPYPSLDQLLTLGSKISDRFPDQDEIDVVVEENLNLLSSS